MIRDPDLFVLLFYCVVPVSRLPHGSEMAAGTLTITSAPQLAGMRRGLPSTVKDTFQNYTDKPLNCIIHSLVI